jgi:predicted DNA-binding transcriptional regulator YafY
MQTSRLFEIIYILLDKKTVTAKELAERVEVSTRTIYRDVDTLSLAGVPVYTEKGKGGGISLLPDFVLNKSILSEQEQGEILTALQSLSNLNVGKTGQVLQRLSTIFNKTVVNWMEVDFSDWSFGNGDIFEGFKEAILQRRVVEFDYYNTSSEKSCRRVEPLQIWFKARAWYLKGFCLARQDIRLFKIIRVDKFKLTDETFGERDLSVISPIPKPEAQPKRYVALKLRIGQEMAYRVHDEFEGQLVEKQEDGSYIVNITWSEDNWMYSFIMSFGEHIEVLEPECVREVVREKARKIVGKYS